MNSLVSASNPASHGRTDADPSAPADVFRYDDYRLFLRARFAHLQSRDPAFSQRRLARKAGIANPGFFNEVIKGRRRLSPAAAAKMSLGLDLTPEECDYFSALVEYSETREPQAKLAAGQRMLGLRGRKFTQTPGLPPQHPEGLQDLARELDREWVLQAAGLDVHPAREGAASPVVPMGEGALQKILDRLVGIREQADAVGGEENAGQVVRVNLEVWPRGGKGE